MSRYNIIANVLNDAIEYENAMKEVKDMADKTISIKRNSKNNMVLCQKCYGSGSITHAESDLIWSERCSECNGSGVKYIAMNNDNPNYKAVSDKGLTKCMKDTFTINIPEGDKNESSI